MIMSPFLNLFFFTIAVAFSYLSQYRISSQQFDINPNSTFSVYNSTANLSTSWINGPFEYEFSASRLVLFGSKYACGFYGDEIGNYLLAVFIFGGDITQPLVVWSANRNNPVKINATLKLTSQGDLVLRDADGSLAWSTNTAGMSVAELNLTELGNLVLFDANKSVVWQSFDHLTDVLVPGQMLMSGQNLTASVSSTNWSDDGGLYTLSMTSEGLVASIGSDPPQVYYPTQNQNLYNGIKQNKEASYAKFQNGSLDLYLNSTEPNDPDRSILIPQTNSPQYMKLGPDGHLRVFNWLGPQWAETDDIFAGNLD